MIYAFSTVFLTTCCTIYVLVKLAPRLGLLALPGAHRQHEMATPMVGGLGISLGLIVSYLFLNEPNKGLMICLTLMCLVGAVDDRYNLPSWFRFVFQGSIAYLLICLTGVQLESLGVLFSNEELILGSWAVPVTIFATIGVINAVNMSDGLDGLAGSLVFIVIVSLLLINQTELPLIVASLSSLTAFLIFNLRVMRSQAKVFMGDAGSTMLGLLLAYLLIKYSQTQSSIMPVTALWLLALPLADAVAVLLVRPLLGKSPFSADHLHYHHQLIDRGLSVNKALTIVLVLQSLFILIGLSLWKGQVNENIQLVLFLVLFFIYVLQLYYSEHQKKNALD